MPDYDENVLVVCKQAMIRDSILHYLQNFDLNFTSTSTITELSDNELDGLDCDPSLIIYVPPVNEPLWHENLAHFAEKYNARWLVLSDDLDDKQYTSLSTIDHVSICPADVTQEELVNTLHLLLNGRRIMMDHYIRHMQDIDLSSIDEIQLSPDQQKLLGYLTDGLSNKVIADLENCDENKVKVRVRALFNRLHVANRTQAAVKAAMYKYKPSQEKTPLPNHG